MTQAKDSSFTLREATFDLPDGFDNIALDENGNVKYASLAKLVTKMTTGSEINLINAFLLTYRSFTTGGREFLTALQLRESNIAKKDPKSIVRIRVFNIIKIWVEKYWPDFEKDCPEISDVCLKWFERIAQDPTNTTLLQIVNTISQNIKKQLSLDKNDKEKLKKEKDKEEALKNENRINLDRAPKPILPKDFNREPINIFLIDSEEIARQMTLHDWKLWIKITNTEFVDLAWKGKDKAKSSPNVLAMLSRFSYVSEWVSSVICLCERTKERAKIVLKFLEIASKLRGMNNYNGVLQILTGLNAAPVARLKETYSIALSKIPKGIMTLDELNALASPANGFANIRKAVRYCNEKLASAQLPYLQMYLNQLGTIYEEKNFVGPNHLINFAKQTQIYETIRDLLVYQEQSYCFIEVPEIQAKLKGEPTFSEGQLSQMSYYLEPLPGKEKGTRPAIFDQQHLKQVESNFVPLQEGLWTQYYNQPESPANTKYQGSKVIGLTLHRLIEQITHHTTPDVRLQAYISNLKLFCSPEKFFEALVLRFNIPNPIDMSEDSVSKFEKYFKDPIQIRVIKVISLWVSKSWEDFVNNPSLKRKLEDFISGIKIASSTNNSGGILPIQHLVDKIQKLDSSPVVKSFPVTGIAPTPSFPYNDNIETLHLFEIDDLEIAQQLTLMLSGLWLQVTESEYTSLTFSESGFLSKLEGSQSGIEAWVLNEVLSSKNQDDTMVANTFNKLAQVAMHCATMNNLLATFAMVSAFKALLDAKKVDVHLCKREVVVFLEQNSLDSIITKSCYHEKSVLTAPCIPTIAAIKKDFSTIQRLWPSIIINPDIICIEKIVLIDDLLSFKQKLQSLAYNLIPVPIVQQYLSIPRKMPKVEGQVFPGGIKGAMIDLITKDSCIEGELSKIIKLSYTSGQPGTEPFSNFRNLLRDLLTQSMDPSFLLIENENFRFTLARTFSGATFANWSSYDANCQVYAEPSEVSCITMSVSDTLYIVDTRDTTTNLDIANLLRIGNFYLQVVKPTNPISCVLVTNHINDQTSIIAARCEIKVLIS